MEMVDQIIAAVGGTWVVVVLTALMLAIFATAVRGLLAQARPAARFVVEGSRVGRGQARLRAHAEIEENQLERYLVPQDKHERSKVRRLLYRAGFQNADALRRFYLVRIGSGLLLLALVLAGVLVVLPAIAPAYVQLFDTNTMIITAIGAIASGFYGPLLAVRWRVASRQAQIRRAFPDALDLLQVTIQAGVGLDAAMQRVGEDIARSCPPLGEEFRVLVLELRAGKGRESALQDFADRLDIDYVHAFTTVLNQSLRFGTSVSDALHVFASDMRDARMTAAEEKANKLPVQMSIVLVLFMLPAILAVALGPVAIRVIRVVMPGLG